MSNPTLTRAEFYEFLTRGFGLSAERPASSKTRFLFELREHLQAAPRGGRLSALVIDEAQSLPYELLGGSAAAEQHRDADRQAAQRRAGRAARAGRPAERDASAAAEAADLVCGAADAARAAGNRGLRRRAPADCGRRRRRSSRGRRSARSTSVGRHAADRERHLRQRVDWRVRGAGEANHAAFVEDVCKDFDDSAGDRFDSARRRRYWKRVSRRRRMATGLLRSHRRWRRRRALRPSDVDYTATPMFGNVNRKRRFSFF